MNDFIIIILSISAFIWLMFSFLHYYMRRKNISLNKKEKETLRFLFIGGIGLIIYFIFFEDADFIFECQKETQKCYYYHSTIYNRELRLVKSYDLTAANEIKIITRRRKSGRYSSRTVYRLKFSGPFDSFEMPKDFSFKDEARKQAELVARFLQTNTPYYTYEKLSPKRSEHELFIVIFLLISLIVPTSGSFIVLCKLFSRRK